MSELLKVSSNPHIRSKVTTSSIMTAVVIALLPAAGFGIYNFGPRALAVMAVTIASTVLTELLFGWLWKKKITITDTSAGKDCAQAIEYYYKRYYFNCIKSQYVIVTVNGKKYNIKEALNNGIVTMDELIDAGFKPQTDAVDR